MLAPDLAPSRPPAAPPVADAQVSVIMIFLDAERFIAEAIESVLAQDFTRWELILVDDGSSDASTRIAKEYARRDLARIRYVEHPGHRNLGMGASRNAGLACARGALVAFLDSDDVWQPRKLGEQVALLRAHPEADLVFGQTKFWFGWSGAAADAARDFTWRLDYPTGRLVAPPVLLQHAPLGNCLKPSMSNFMARRSFLGRIGNFEASFVNLREDYAFWVKAFYNGTVFHAEACWDWCRHHAGSFSSIELSRAQARAESQHYYRWVIDYLAARGVTDPYLRSLLAQFRLKHAWPGACRFLPQYHYHRTRRVLLRAARQGLGAELRSRVARLRRGTW